MAAKEAPHTSRRRLAIENSVAMTLTTGAAAAAISMGWFDHLCMTMRRHEAYQLDELAGAAFLFLTAFVIMFARRETQLLHKVKLIQRSEAECHRMARCDFLTGLPNRLALIERIGEARGHRTAFLLMDLDGFKKVNDGRGHAAGDAVLIEVARRLSRIAAMCPGATVARLGGDEFGCLLIDMSDEKIARFIDALIRGVAEPISFAGADLAVGASVGIAFSIDGLSTADHLLQDADQAMYEAKKTGGGRACTALQIGKADSPDWTKPGSDPAHPVICFQQTSAGLL